MNRVDRNDIGVLQLGQRLRFVENIGCHLEGDRTISEVALLGQVNPAKGPATQFADQLEPEKFCAHFRQLRKTFRQQGGFLGSTQVQIAKELGFFWFGSARGKPRIEIVDANGFRAKA